MKKRTSQKKSSLAVVLLCILVLCAGIMTGCGGSGAQSYDLQQVYSDILSAQPEGTDELGGVMFEITDEQVIEDLYPGLGAIELKQEVYYQHAITGFCEIMLVEAADSKDVQTIADIFNKRIEVSTDDSFYPETAQLWAENSDVQISGNYVALVALPIGNVIPEQIFS